MDSDSDSDEFDGEDGTMNNWLEEEDPEDVERPQVAVVESQPKISISNKSDYIKENSDLYLALCDVDDFGFVDMPDDEQERLMKTLEVIIFMPGQTIMQEGETTGDVYFVVATESTAHIAEVEVVTGNILAGTEVFLTRQHRGQIFGQKYFITKRLRPRTATIRVPRDSPVNVPVARLACQHFDKWNNFRNLLLVKPVPLIQMLPRKERLEIIDKMKIKEYSDGEYIVVQDEIGEEFFIIQEGAVKIVEKRPPIEKGGMPTYVTLTTLREGHFFGEMSIVTDAPRVASVISLKFTICLTLSKSDFQSALGDDTFQNIVHEVLSQRTEIRKEREKAENAKISEGGTTSDGSNPNSHPSDGSHSAESKKSGLSKQSFKSYRTLRTTSEVTVSSTVKLVKLESGYRQVNKYLITQFLGSGAFGEVHLCEHQETHEKYAMKIINRPPASWNDEASKMMKQEIAVMKRLYHQNIVALHEVIDDPSAKKIYLIQELMEGGPLMPDMVTCEPLPLSSARKYFRDILRGVCYLHSEGIVHRDLKPQNVLLTNDGVAKISDFGAAVFTMGHGDGDQKVAYGGTPAFMAPELFLTNTTMDFGKYPGIDIFALGATLYFMIFGKPPWMAKNQLELATLIKNIELTFPELITNAENNSKNNDVHLKHLLKQMLFKEWQVRISLDAIVVHEWVTKEGLEPVFDRANDFTNEDPDGIPPIFEVVPEDPLIPFLRILIIHSSFVTRKMFSQHINTVTSAWCALVATAQEGIDAVEKCYKKSNENLFDYIFCDVKLIESNTISSMRDKYKNKLLGLADNSDETAAAAIDRFQTLLGSHDGNEVVRLPVSERELKVILKDDNEGRSSSSGKFFSEKEVDEAITTSAPIEELMNKFIHLGIKSEHTQSADEDEIVEPYVETPLRGDGNQFNLDDDDDDDGTGIKDFQTYSIKPVTTITESISLTRGKSETKVLPRTRGFIKVTAYGSSTDSGDDGKLGVISYDKPLKIFSVNKNDPQRRKKREEAMNRSKQAHMQRAAALRRSSRRASQLMALKDSNSNYSGSQRSSNLSNVSNNHNTSFTSMTPQTLQRATPTDGIVQLNDIDFLLKDEINNDNNGDPIEEYHDDDDDIPIGGTSPNQDDADSDLDHGDIMAYDDDSEDDVFTVDEIEQLDDKAMDDLFDQLTTKKNPNETVEIQQWNHIMVGRVYVNPLIASSEKINPLLKISFGECENRVGRTYMEDRIFGNAFMTRSRPDLSPLSILAVFDGHNGQYVAEFLQEKFASTFTQKLDKREIELPRNTIPMKSIFEETISELDLDILDRDFIRQQKHLANGGLDTVPFAGSVAVMAAIMPSLTHPEELIDIFVAHVGDCRAVLCSDGNAVQLTEDHKANNKTEKARIEAAGGWVHNGRVGSSLVVARSIGDIQYKEFNVNIDHTLGHEMKSNGIWSTEQQVISKPDVKHFVVESTHEFVILASDGLWDVFNCQEAVNFVRKQLSIHGDVNKAAAELVEKAIARHTVDNTSVIICALNQNNIKISGEKA
eukprot:gene5579-7704_t